MAVIARAMAEVRVARAMQLAEEFVATGHSPGLAVGVVQRGVATVVRAFGEQAPGIPATEDTQWQIGSITKVFTGLLLAREESKEKGFIDSAVRKHLPDWGVAEEVRMHHLCTHTSGFPSIAPGWLQYVRLAVASILQMIQSCIARRVGVRLAIWMPGVSPMLDPYKNIDDHELQCWVRRAPRGPAGKSMSYSNMGVGIAGVVLAQRNKASYRSLVRDFIFDPAQMTSSGFDIPADSTHVAQGHTQGKIPVPFWTLGGSIAAAGGIYSSVRDMSRFAAALLGDDEQLQSWFELARQPLPYGATPRMAFGMNWVVPPGEEDAPLVFHNGQTNGFHGFLGIHGDTAVVVLSNCANSSGTMLARGILDIIVKGETKRWPPQAAPRLRSSKLSAAQLSRYLGSYTFDASTDFVISYSRVFRTLAVQARGSRVWLPVHASEEEGVFHQPWVGATLRFDEAVLVLEQSGQRVVLPRAPLPPGQ